MFDLYTWPTPNGRKVSILLEELELDYNIIPIDIYKGDQFSEKFESISVDNKIPIIYDHNEKIYIRESGIILMYLADKFGKFIDDYKNTYFKKVFDVLSSKYKLGRVRILLKEPRSTLSWHRDPEPRLHIPIITNPGSIMVIDNVAKHMPADGSVWITNNTKYHNAFNGGEENRIHLVACVLDYKFN